MLSDPVNFGSLGEGFFERFFVLLKCQQLVHSHFVAQFLLVVSLPFVILRRGYADGFDSLEAAR